MVNTHDFPSQAIGKACPYGIYDEKNNEGFVNVGISHDTAQFAVASIRKWWEQLGKKRFPKVKKLLIMADNRGSNGSRLRLWKVCLQEFADDTGLEVTVCHFPTGTSKWNKIEHRLFSFISINWRGKPLTSFLCVVEFINHTTTTTGLKVKAELDCRLFEVGTAVTDEELQQISITRHAWHPNWNYTIHPRK